jgi:hypothetical protein
MDEGLLMRALLLAILFGSLGLAPAVAHDNGPKGSSSDAAPVQKTVPAPAQPSQPAAPTPSAQPRSEADTKLVETILYYYVRKDISKLPVIFDAIRDNDRMAHTGLSRAVLAGFLSMVFIQNRSRVEGWIGTTSYPLEAKAILEFSLWQSGNSDLISALFHERPDFVNTKPGNLFALTPRSPVEMDLKWGAFYATGNPGFVGAMVDALDKSRGLTGSRELDAAIRKASALGLAVNMRDHEMIERFLRQRAAEATGDYKQALDTMLAARTAEIKPAADHDGDFSGQIATVMLPDATRTNADAISSRLSVDSGPQTARRGDTVGVTVLFSGMALADDLSADVSYDIKVTAPDGTIDDHSSKTDVRALKEKIPTRFNVLDSRSTLSIHFEPDDKSGPYRIDVLLKDNIGGHKVALSKSIELLDR